MATRLASVLKKKTMTEAKTLRDGSIKENQAVSRKTKKVTFRPERENEIFEFTRSVKKPRRTNVRSCSQEMPAQDIQLGRNIELRRSKRLLANGILKTRKECSLWDVTKAQIVPRRSKQIGFSGRGGVQEESKETELMALEQFEANKEDVTRGFSGNNNQVRRRSPRLAAISCMGSGTSEVEILLPTKRSKLLVVDTSNKEEDHELVNNNTNELSMEPEVQETRKHHRKDVEVGPKDEKVLRRVRRFVNEMTNTQDQRRRSLRLKAIAASMGSERASDGIDLCFAKESKEERNALQSRRICGSRYSQEGGELVKNIMKDPLVDCNVQTNEKQRKMKVQNGSIGENVLRRSKRRRCSPIQFWRSSSVMAQFGK